MSHEIEQQLGYRFRQGELLETALTHRSLSATRKAPNNEKLEFLGDSVLELAISDLLMKQFPHFHEGELSKLRASLVNTRSLAHKARDLGLGRALRLGKGEEKNGGRNKDSILAAGYEALLGAVYLDRGFVAARRVLARQFAADIKTRSLAGVGDWKTALQELTQKLFRATPTYTLVRESGPDHEKNFVSQISVGGRTLGRGAGHSKKSAEQAAANEALQALQTEADAARPKKGTSSKSASEASGPAKRTSSAKSSDEPTAAPASKKGAAAKAGNETSAAPSPKRGAGGKAADDAPTPKKASSTKNSDEAPTTPASRKSPSGSKDVDESPSASPTSGRGHR